MTEYFAIVKRASLALAKSILALALLAIGLVTIAVNTGVFTEAIAARVVAELNAHTSLNLRYASVTGVPIRNLTIKDLEINIGDQAVSVKEAEMTWSPFQLMSNSLDISSLKLTGVQLTVSASSNPAEPGREQLLSTLDPIGIELVISELIVDGFALVTNDQVVTIDTLQTALAVNDQLIALSGLFIRKTDNELTGSIDVSVGNSPHLEADLDWYSPALQANIPSSVLSLLPQLGAEVPSGQLQINGWTQELTVKHSLLTPIAMSSNGTLTNPLELDSLFFSFTQNADSLLLDTSTGTLTTLNQVQIDVEGNLLQQTFRVSTDVQDERLADVTLAAQLTLAEQQLLMQTLELQTASGTALGNATIDFSNAIRINGSFTINDTAPLSVVNIVTPFDLANLTSNGDFAISQAPQGWNGTVEVSELLGVLSGYPLKGNAAFSLQNNTLVIDALTLATNDNSLGIAGSLADAAGIRWNLDVPALNQVLPNANGSIRGRGTLSTINDSLAVLGMIEAKAIDYQTLFADEVLIDFDFNQDAVAATIALKGVSQTENEVVALINQANLVLNGNPESHRINGVIDSPFASVTTAIAGSFSQAGTDWDWTGAVSSAQVNSSYGLWQLGSALQISLNNSLEISVSGGCFEQQSTRLCTSLSGSVGNSLQSQLSLNGLPLSQLNQGSRDYSNEFVTPQLPSLPSGFQLDGTVSALITAGFGTTAPEINLSIESEGTRLTIDPAQFDNADESVAPELEVQSYLIDQLSITASGNLDRLGLISQIRINEMNLHDETLTAPGLVSSEVFISNMSELEGDIRLSLPSLDWVPAVVAGVSNVQGGATSSIKVSGSIQQPSLGGNIEVSNLGFDVDALGVRFRDANLSAEQAADGSYVISGSLNSGEGAATVSGRINDLFLASWSAEGEISGSNFLFINRPELSITASPDLSLNASAALIDISGQLGLPTLQLDVESLPDSAIDVSRDVVITNNSGTLPNQDTNVYVDERSLFSIPLAADINVTLEDNVRFNGFGISAALGGDINYRQTATGASSTYGELSILSGSYKAYQQELVIRQGQFLFFGALDNPALDIRAVREVNDITVGVLMNGTLKSINSQLFSTPALPENDIISLIATGRKFSSIGEGDDVNILNTIANLGLNRSQGFTNSMRDRLGLDALAITNTGDINNSVLTVGKYVTPDIFIRYGVGLFDNQSKISVDYTLGENLKLQAESGEFQSIDITYSVEK